MVTSIIISNILNNRFIYIWPIIMIIKELLNTGGTWIPGKLLIISFLNNNSNITNKDPKIVMPI